MSGNSHERRIDARGLNYMQRVFDELAVDVGISVSEIARRTHMSEQSIASAIKRLRLQRALQAASYIDGAWLYRRHPDAMRPLDRRGGGLRRQMMQVAA